jgi:catalase
MAHYVDDTGVNPHVNYEPSSTGGLDEADAPGKPYEPEISGRLTRATLERESNYVQAGERYRTMPEWEREDLVLNLVDMLGQCERQIQERMVGHFAQCDDDFGRRVAAGLGVDSTAAVATTGARTT